MGTIAIPTRQVTALPPTNMGNRVSLLVNNHPPLLGDPQQQPSGFHTVLSSPHVQDVQPTLHAQPDQEEYRLCQPRHDFLRSTVRCPCSGLVSA